MTWKANILYYFALSYTILSYPILTYFISFYLILSYLIDVLPYPILSYPILSHPILILSHLILVILWDNFRISSQPCNIIYVPLISVHPLLSVNWIRTEAAVELVRYAAIKPELFQVFRSSVRSAGRRNPLTIPRIQEVPLLLGHHDISLKRPEIWWRLRTRVICNG